jgi:type IV secretion system protein VirB3
MSKRNAGITTDALFVGATRPSMRWGVTYSALLVNMVVTMEIFLLSRNLLSLLLAAPIHGIAALLCTRDPRYFDLLLLWGRTRLPALFGNLHYWKASSYSPLALEPSVCRRSRNRRVCVRIPDTHVPVRSCVL